ncbi:junctional adhesion molecule B-like [Eriocheir sinensis]|uniref:junctional adhesion molecule B-like n=1 Tax=Eriocheir sinensis TaxID=95602 RepID=UPI0021C9483C|nr:junctional adhesion molecule B-like [Eriocheir sinensis]XP_050720359.1 junctional adhesion molecule B-like [Eriocheir sinensis]XP_050720361.1 junctional adhesion molecule B-like [Eriocheir sinensis]
MLRFRLLLLLLLRLSVCLEEGEGEAGSGVEVEPRFLHEQLSLNVSVQLGSTAYLHCRVEGINDQSVSWYRKSGDEIQLITFDFQTYHNDDRFAVTFAQPNDWRLRIRFVQRRDEGSYQCQVSTHPPLIHTVHLQVVEASIQILDERGVELREKFYREGSTMELQCLVADVPTATALQLSWYHHHHRLNYDDPRGGVSLKTELRGSVARSWLRVSQAGRRDSGVYYCNVTNLAAASVTIHVVPDEYPAAIQGAPTPSLCGLTLLASLLTSLLTAGWPPHR